MTELEVRKLKVGDCLLDTLESDYNAAPSFGIIVHIEHSEKLHEYKQHKNDIEFDIYRIAVNGIIDQYKAYMFGNDTYFERQEKI